MRYSQFLREHHRKITCRPEKVWPNILSHFSVLEIFVVRLHSVPICARQCDSCVGSDSRKSVGKGYDSRRGGI
jgi:hypothetical protein